MIRYQVRSKELIDVISDLKSGRLIKSPYFQRNLVWREIHKIDFIKTILMGLPFPQIFIAKGEINVETMTTYSCVVDGQQRLTAIKDYIDGKIEVDGNSFDDLNNNEKEEFLKYQIPIIDLDVKQDDPLLKEIFKRLNRTFYALSNIEKLSTEYATSDLMIAAKILSDQLFIYDEDDEGESKARDTDPLIPKEIIKSAKKVKIPDLHKLIIESYAFSHHEIARKVHVNFALNILATCHSGWYHRNSGVTNLLDDTSVNFEEYCDILKTLNKTAAAILKLKLKPDSYWLNKANLFSIIILFYNHTSELENLKPAETKKLLNSATENLPQEYALAAKEAVNNKRERIIRNNYLENLLFPDQ